MGRAKQLSFHKNKAFQDFKTRIEHGGGTRTGKRKLARPFDSKKSVHVTLRSSRAVKRLSFLSERNQSKVNKAVYSYAERFGVEIKGYANVGNHLHILVKAKTRRAMQNYLRTVSGVIPRIVTGARKGRPHNGGRPEFGHLGDDVGPHRAVGALRSGSRKFWDALAYTKLVSFGRHFNATKSYVFRNQLEAAGVIPHRRNALGHETRQINYEEWFREVIPDETPREL